MKLAACAAIFVIPWILVLTNTSSSSPESDKVARGKYIVEGVSMCGDCHTPHDEKGQPIAGKTLRGTALPFKPIDAMPVWADRSPNIAGLRAWTDEQAVKFLMTGIAYNDLPGRPPMPAYHMNREDAEAVVAYLRTLSPVDK